MPGAVRLAVSLLTCVPIRATSTDRRTVGAAMTIAPLVGLVLGGAAAGVLTLTSVLLPRGSAALLPAALAVATLAVGSRLLHLDGLADTADAFGIVSSNPEAAQAAMKAPNVGAFGVVAIVLALGLDIAALDTATSAGRGTLALLAAAGTSRLAATWACRRSVKAAVLTGLGALVAGSVPLARSVVAVVLLAGGIGALGAFTDHAGLGGAAQGLIGVAAGLAVGEICRAAACRRVGGLTGDVLGATIEVATAASLIAVAVAVRLAH